MPNTTIPVLQRKIDETIDTLGKYIISYVSRPDYGGKVDYFPFFSLIINLKKSLYENIINSFAKSGSLDILLTADEGSVEDYTPLIEKWGVTRKDNEIVFPSLKTFLKPHETGGEGKKNAHYNYLLLDTERLFSYIKSLERFLCNTTTVHFLLCLYECFNLEGNPIIDKNDPFRCQPFKLEDGHYVLNPNLTSGNSTISTKQIDIALREDGWDEKEMDFFFTDIFYDSDYALRKSDLSAIDCLWALFTDENTFSEIRYHNPKYSNGILENLFVFGLKGHGISNTDYQDKFIGNISKKKVITPNDERAVFIECVKRTLDEKTIQGYLQLFIDICQEPAFAMPEGILLDTLQQTYDNMFQIVLSQRVTQKCAELGIGRVELSEKVSIPNARNKMQNDFGYYRDKRKLKDAEIDQIASVLGVESAWLKEI